MSWLLLDQFNACGKFCWISPVNCYNHTLSKCFRGRTGWNWKRRKLNHSKLLPNLPQPNLHTKTSVINADGNNTSRCIEETVILWYLLHTIAIAPYTLPNNRTNYSQTQLHSVAAAIHATSSRMRRLIKYSWSRETYLVPCFIPTFQTLECQVLYSTLLIC